VKIVTLGRVVPTSRIAVPQAGMTASGGTAAPVAASTDLPDAVRSVLADPAYGRVVAFRQG
jgi:hypothetical protein